MLIVWASGTSIYIESDLHFERDGEGEVWVDSMSSEMTFSNDVFSSENGFLDSHEFGSLPVEYK